MKPIKRLFMTILIFSAIHVTARNQEMLPYYIAIDRDGIFLRSYSMLQKELNE